LVRQMETTPLRRLREAVGADVAAEGTGCASEAVVSNALGPAACEGCSRIEVRSPWGLCVPESAGAVFHILLEGVCWLVPAAGSPLLPLGAGDLVLLPRGARHMLTAAPPNALGDGPNAGRSLLLSSSHRSSRPLPLLASLPEVIHLPAHRCRQHGLRAIVDLLGAELEKDQPEAAAVVPALADALVPLVARSWLDDCAAGPGGDAQDSSSDIVIAAAIERIHTEPERAWTLTALAREVSLSRSAFARRFAVAVGEPPGTYLAHWRMTIAGRLLRESDLKLAAVARRVGYTSEFAFAKAFKRDYGIAPGSYRRQLAA
jgi:AraC-like DNA-binding protein